MFSVLNVKFMDEKKYSPILETVFEILKNEAKMSMDNALCEEMSQGNFNKQISKYEIGAIGDALWSKRSYNQNYNANSCCGCLIECASKRVIFIGIRNKFCSRCNIDTKNSKDHFCFKNWTRSSSEMEADILRESFHDVDNRSARITKFIADADANTYPLLRLSCN